MPTVVRFDCYEVDLAAGQLLKRGVKIHLREQSFQVLGALLTRPGEVVTREELRQRLWPDNVFVDFDNNLNGAVARLREVLNDSAERPRFIETLPRHGYRFVGTICEPAPTPAPSAVTRTRLLVLPFVNSSGDAAQDYFSDAVTDEIITELARLRSDKLAVLARTTSMQLKRTRKDVAQIGRELSVDYVVEGGVRRADDRVLMTTQLIRTSDHTHVFANKYETELGRLSSVEEEIARGIARELGVTDEALVAISRARAWTAGRRPTANSDAVTAYLRGRHYLDAFTPDAMTMAKDLLEEAIRLDPGFALPYKALAEYYWRLGFNGFAAPREVCSTGLFYALRAIEIDNTVAETHALIGQFRTVLGYNWAEVEREMRLALELDPRSPDVRLKYAMSSALPHARLNEAITELECALEFDPLSLVTRIWLGIFSWLARHYERAIEESRKALDLDSSYGPAHLAMGQTLTMEHRFDDAIHWLRRAVEISGGSPMVLGWLGLALAMNGNADESRELLARLGAMAVHAHVPPTSFAWIHFGLGEIDEAFAWMDKAIDARDPMMIPLKTYPFLDPIRDDPRFRALLNRMNLEP